jgi:hypothetical protein
MNTTNIVINRVDNGFIVTVQSDASHLNRRVVATKESDVQDRLKEVTADLFKPAPEKKAPAAPPKPA